MDQSELESRLQQWSVPSDVRDAVRQSVASVAGGGVDLVGTATEDLVSLSVRGKPIAVTFSESRVSVALEPPDAERVHGADSALGLDKDSETSWTVHCRYGRLDSSRLNSMAALIVRALRRFAPPAPVRSVPKGAPRKRASSTVANSKGAAPTATRSSRTTAANQEERRRIADAAIPRCPVPGCNLPMVGGSCGFHD